MSSATDDGHERPETTDVAVTVRRTGGIAGIAREWSAQAAPDETGRWIVLIEECPWDAARSDTRGADRFVWSIHARLGAHDREAELPDRDVLGPWRVLVDAVREASAPEQRSRPPKPV